MIQIFDIPLDFNILLLRIFCLCKRYNIRFSITKYYSGIDSFYNKKDTVYFEIKGKCYFITVLRSCLFLYKIPLYDKPFHLFLTTEYIELLDYIKLKIILK